MTILKHSNKYKASSILIAVTVPLMLLLLAFVGLQFAGAADEQSAALQVVSADLGIGKVATPDLVAAGEQVTYTLTVNNSGTLSATNVIVSDSLPGGVTMAMWSTDLDGATCDDTADPVVCLLGGLDIGASVLITLVVDVDPGITGILVNEAEVASDSVDADGSNNNASESITILASADLSLVKTAHASTVVAGEPVTYTLTIHNAGPSTAPGITVIDELPRGTNYVSGSGASCDRHARTIECSLLGPLQPGASAVITLVFGINSEVSGPLINEAEVSSDVADDSPGNNLGSALVTVNAEADLSLVKTASTNNVFPGDRLTYTLVIDNAGPSDASNVVISDTLPPGTSFVSAGGASCTDVDNLLDCSVPGSIAAGAGTAVTLVVDVAAGAFGTLANYAQVSSDAADNLPENNLDSALVTVNAGADLSLVKTANASGVFPGERLTYTLVIDNAGPSDASNVVISDTLPLGTSFVSSNGASCTDVDNLLDCSIPGSIAAGAGTAVTLVVDVEATALGILANYAQVSSDVADNLPGNNLDSALVTVHAEADLSLVKTANASSVFPGERLTYTLAIENAGPSDASNVVISDTLPPGTSFVSASGASCSNVNNLLDCSVPGSIVEGAGNVVTLVVDVEATALGILANYAQVSSDVADNLPGNNLDSALVTVHAEADLSLVKSASSSSVFAGERLTYTLAVHNAGPSDAVNVTISDTLPSGTSFVSAGGASCTDVDNLLDCSVPGSITAGAGTVVTVVVDVDSAALGPLTNYAEVSSDAADSSPGANLGSASTIIHHRVERVYLPMMQNGIPTGEPNNTCEQAYRITPNDNHWFMPNDVFDWYEFDLSFAGNMTVELADFTPIRGQVAAYKSADCDSRKEGFLGNVGDAGLTKILNLGPQDPGHYYIFVGSDGLLSETQPYRLRISVHPAGP